MALALLLAASAACAHAAPSSAADEPASPPATGARAEAKPERKAEQKAEPPVPVPRAAVLEEVTGSVRAIDRRAHTVTVQTSGGAVTLSLDRNTMVYTPAGLGTVLDLTPGAQVRAGRDADLLAYWVQVRGPPRPEPVPVPGQGTGPGGGAGPPPERVGAPGAAPLGPPSTRSATPP